MVAIEFIHRVMMNTIYSAQIIATSEVTSKGIPPKMGTLTMQVQELYTNLPINSAYKGVCAHIYI